MCVFVTDNLIYYTDFDIEISMILVIVMINFKLMKNNDEGRISFPCNLNYCKSNMMNKFG